MREQYVLNWEGAHVHRRDPETSLQAAESVRETASKHRAEILAAVSRYALPIAAEPLADCLGLSTLQVMKRLSDLRNAGAIVDSGDLPPLDELEDQTLDLFENECEGMCGV